MLLFNSTIFQNSQQQRRNSLIKMAGNLMLVSVIRSSEKNRYRSVSGQNYSSEIICNTFRNDFNDLLQNRLQTNNPYRYDYAIMNIPSNSDDYSDVDFNCMKSGNLCNL